MSRFELYSIQNFSCIELVEIFENEMSEGEFESLFSVILSW